jgi:ligand-binding sensor domain-containing protein
MRNLYSRTFILILTLAFISCSGQVKTDIRVGKQIAGGQPKIIKNHFFTEYPEEFFFVQCGLQDRTGNMWFGTAGNGIYVYNGNTFVNFTHKSFIDFSLKNDLNHSDILCCMEDKTGNIWFGTRRGLIRYKPSGGRIEARDFRLFLIPENTISNTNPTRLPYTFRTGDNFVWSIMQDKTGKIWFGTSKGVFVHNPLTDNENGEPLFRRFPDTGNIENKDSLELKNVLSMVQDKKGNIWFASDFTQNEGICCYDGKSVTSFKPGGVSSFRSIMEGNNGILYFLNTFQGVFSYDGKSFTNFSKNIGLTNDSIVSIKQDKAGNFWFGLSSVNIQNGGVGGVWRYDGLSLKHFTTRDGLSHNCVFCIVEDTDGNIWFGTRNTGLCRFNGKSFTDYTE